MSFGRDAHSCERLYINLSAEIDPLTYLSIHRSLNLAIVNFICAFSLNVSFGERTQSRTAHRSVPRITWHAQQAEDALQAATILS